MVLVLAGAGCATAPGGPPAESAGKALAETILRRNAEVADATLVGRFILQGERGSTKGSLRIRYIKPDIYRVDVLVAGVAGAGGGSSFYVEGDSLLVYVSPGHGADSASIEEVRVVTFLDEFDLGLADLKALVVSGPYLDLLSLSKVACRGVRGGYVLEGPGAFGEIFTIWIDNDKEAVVKGVRGGGDGLPLVEVRLSKFKRYEGTWRPTRAAVRHFGQRASLSVQYERIVVNGGLKREDLSIRRPHYEARAFEP